MGVVVWLCFFCCGLLVRYFGLLGWLLFLLRVVLNVLVGWGYVVLGVLGFAGVGCVSWFVCFGFGCGSSRLLTIDCGCWLPVVCWLVVDLCPEMVFCVLVLVLWFANLVVLGACNGGLGVLSVCGWVCCW